MRVLIIGAGIGGLTTALALHHRGVDDITITEQAPGIAEMGVGINVLPHAVKELAELGLLDRLDATGIRTGEILLTNRHGDLVSQQPCGTAAGYPHPQFSLHRGRLQGVLHQAVAERLGTDTIRLGHRCARVEHDANGATARFTDADGAALPPAHADVIIAADGIHSAVRAQFHPDEGPPLWSGKTLYRGATTWPAFADGHRMIIAGAMTAKLVLYPIGPSAQPGHRVTNWVIMREQPSATPPPRRQDWARPADHDQVAQHLELFGRRGPLADIDVPALIAATEHIYEFPMSDRDPLPRWTHGRVTLLGDAAHPMYPNGANGAGQAILDATAIAEHLATHTDPAAALAAYDAHRRPATADIVRLNRIGATEHVLELADQRAPDGFDSITDIISPDEITAILTNYARTTGLTTTDHHHGPRR